MSLKRVIPAALLGGILSSIDNSVEAKGLREKYEPQMKSLGLGDAFSNWYNNPSLSNSNNLAKKLLGEDVQIEQKNGENVVYFTPDPNTSQPTPVGPDLPNPIKIKEKELNQNYKPIKNNEIVDNMIIYKYNSTNKELQPIYDIETVEDATDKSIIGIKGRLSKGDNSSEEVKYDLKNNTTFYVKNTEGGRKTRKRRSKHRKTKRSYK